MKINRRTDRSSTERTGYVAIHNGDTVYYEQHTEVCDVEIGEGSKRRWALMNEDRLVLRFTSERNILFKVGDFVWYDDRRFILTSPYHPSDNADNGGYDYEIPFEADYRAACNRMFKLSGKETAWSLTAGLAAHLTQWADMMRAEDMTYRYKDNGAVYERYYGFHVDDYTPGDSENILTSVKSITYSGVSLLDAITKMAETWKCEWWFDEEILYFGRCERGDYVAFHRDYLNDAAPNIESIDGQGASDNYATRIYVFGSQDNLPARYDRKLVFEQTGDPTTLGGYKIFSDTSRRLNPDMFSEGEHVTFTHPNPYSETIWLSHWGQKITIPTALRGASDVAVNITLACTGTANYHFFKVEARIYTEDVDRYFSVFSEDVEYEISGQYSFGLQGSGVVVVTDKVYMEIICYGKKDGSYIALPYNVEGLRPDLLSGSATVTLRKVSIATKVNFGGDDKDCVINPTLADETEAAFSQVRVASGDYSAERYTLPYIDEMNAPLWYYTNVNPLGYSERRLHMDDSDETGLDYVKRGTYIQDSSVSDDEVVEDILVLDEVCPKCTLKVTGVDSRTETEKSTQGSVTHTYYDLRVKLWDASTETESDFVFSTKSILEGGKLSARFISGLLNGYDFDMGFYPKGRNGFKDYQEFEIVNGTSGNIEIPNTVLKPQEGDLFVLYGWDVQSMAMDSLVTAAQNILKDKAVTYLRRTRIDANTYSCPMFSDVPNDFSVGQKVKLYSPLFKDGYRLSRITGGEFNLDIPWDTPVYTIAQEVSYATQTDTREISAIQDVVDDSFFGGHDTINPAGNINLPIYIDAGSRAQPITGLDVPEDIHADKDIHAGGGVSAEGITDLSVNGGGGGGTGTIRGIEVNGQTYDNPSVDGILTLPDYPDEPTHLSDLQDDSSHRTVTDIQITGWNAKYNKPSGGIPKTDLSSAVQASLDKADGAVQKTDLASKGSNVRPVYFDEDAEAQEIDGLHVPENVEAGGGVSARGITDLGVSGGGGGTGGGVETVSVNGGTPVQPDPFGNVDLDIELADLPQDNTHQTVSDTEKSQWNAAASKTVVTYAGLDPTESESTGKVPTAFAVAVLKKQIGVEDNYTAATSSEAMIDGFEDYDSSKVGGYKRGDTFRIGDGGEHIAAYRVIVDMPTFNWGCLQRINFKALATPLQILGTAINELD